MTDSANAGSNWTRAELDLIVADYFTMLREEQAGQPYSKTAHRRALRRLIDRSDGSIEYKHQNISAVLTELGLPIIGGYRPAWNFQGMIFDAIGSYLVSNPDPVPFDPALRDQLNRALGFAGEQRVFEFEQHELVRLDRPDLARKVRWVSQEDGDGVGYDIRSFDANGHERLIEVKTTRGSSTTPFYLTRNENEVARERGDAFRLYRLYDFSKAPRLFALSPPLEQVLQLEPLTFRASLK